MDASVTIPALDPGIGDTHCRFRIVHRCGHRDRFAIAGVINTLRRSPRTGLSLRSDYGDMRANSDVWLGDVRRHDLAVDMPAVVLARLEQVRKRLGAETL